MCVHSHEPDRRQIDRPALYEHDSIQYHMHDVMTHLVPEVGVSSTGEKVTDHGRVSIIGSTHQRSHVELHGIWAKNNKITHR